MGSSKALLPVGGKPLIVHVVSFLRALFADVVVVAAPDQELPPLSCVVVRDEVAYQGPLSGLRNGLAAAGHDITFATSCDSPFLSASLIEHLVACLGNYDAVVPRWQDRDQPLHAVYHRRILPIVDEQLARGQRRLLDVLPRLQTCRLSEDAIRRFDRTGHSFVNINTPADYARALKERG